jgi:hypothetical protein
LLGAGRHLRQREAVSAVPIPTVRSSQQLRSST